VTFTTHAIAVEMKKKISFPGRLRPSLFIHASVSSMNNTEQTFAFYFKGGVVSVPSDEVSSEQDSLNNRTLYKNSISVLAVLVDDVRFDICGKYMQLVTRRGSSVHTYAVVLEDPRKVHFYRRLLAQKALSSYSDEFVFARLVEHAYSAGALDTCRVAPAPPLSFSAKSACTKETVPLVTPEDLWVALQCRVTAPLAMEIHMDFLGATAFFTTLFYGDGSSVLDAGVFAQTIQSTQKLSIACLLANIATSDDYTDAYLLKKSF
jgi:hypothetical protein